MWAWLQVPNRRLLFKLFSFGVFGLVCLAQCYTILIEYFQHPTMINLYDVSPSLFSVMPGITVCNNNRISLSKLLKRNETFRRRFHERIAIVPNADVFGQLDKQELRAYRDNLSSLFDALNYEPQLDIERVPVRQWFELRPDNGPFIERLGCTPTFSNSLNCGRLTRVDSVTNRICTTLLHKGALLNDQEHRPHLFNDTPAVSFSSEPADTRDYMSYFDAKELIKMVINFEPEDYGDLRRSVGGRVLFHEDTRVASASELDFYIAPGFRYEFSVDRKDIKLLGSPYDDCTDYEAAHLERFRTHVDPRWALGEETCLQNCIVRNVLHHAGCWPHTMPYFRNDSLDLNWPGAKTCGWLRSLQHFSIAHELNRLEDFRKRASTSGHRAGASPSASSTADMSSRARANGARAAGRMKSYQKMRRFCLERCIPSCYISEYQVSVTKSVWPSEVQVLFDASGRARRRRNCCALVAIKFLHYHHSVNEFRPKFDLANTVGDIGGLLACWLGLSIVSIYHALHKLAGFCARLGRPERAAPRQQQQQQQRAQDPLRLAHALSSLPTSSSGRAWTRVTRRCR